MFYNCSVNKHETYMWFSNGVLANMLHKERRKCIFVCVYKLLHSNINTHLDIHTHIHAHTQIQIYHKKIGVG